MAALTLYLAFVGASCFYALSNWRRAWLLVVICAVIQDPVRKLTSGTPVWISFAVVILYAALLWSARKELALNLRDFRARFPSLQAALAIMSGAVLLATLNGLITFGIANWQVPLLGLFTYSLPLAAALFGYTWAYREEWLYRYFTLYAAVTSVALIGTLFEYLRIDIPGIGLVGADSDWIRHLPGIQIRLLSGFYRSPDVMAWHAATLTCVAAAMAARRTLRTATLLWGGLAAWGFFNCMIAGRRKAIYYAAAFAACFLWRYFRRLRVQQILGVALVSVMLILVVRHFTTNEDKQTYARGATATQSELTQRLEGGVMVTFRQSGFVGLGLGSATQGVYHLAPGQRLAWQEGGLSKLALEIGLPGLLATALLAFVVIRLLLRLTAIADVPGSSQFIRVTLFALVIANVLNFMASAQAYTDAVLALMTGFFVGALFATAALDERLASTMPAGKSPVQLTPAVST
jgi:hypothetical protein